MGAVGTRSTSLRVDCARSSPRLRLADTALAQALTSEPCLRACAYLQGPSTSHITFATSLGSTSSLSIDGITSTAASPVLDMTSHGMTGTGAKTPPVAGSGGSAKSRPFSVPPALQFDLAIVAVLSQPHARRQPVNPNTRRAKRPPACCFGLEWWWCQSAERSCREHLDRRVGFTCSSVSTSWFGRRWRGNGCLRQLGPRRLSMQGRLRVEGTVYISQVGLSQA